MNSKTEAQEKVTYIDHSGFFLEREHTCFLFDYYRGEIPETNEDKEWVVFVSHHHQDHYNPAIYELVKTKKRITYILPKGMPVKKYAVAYEEEGIDFFSHIRLLAKNTTQELALACGETLQITTLKSTDAGVAYLLQIQGRTYYHAGDLNLWLWEEADRQTQEIMRRRYEVQLEKLKGRKIDIAFLPLDPRLENHAFDGMAQFLETTDTKKAYPMHCWGDDAIAARFVQEFPQYREIVCV